jgi:4a-hydroxytetrahydrobiopterin dehydratase
MERRLLAKAELEAELGKVSGWTLKDKAISKRFEFADFTGALNFVNRVGDIANAADHHPDIKLGWGYAEFDVMTHDRGGVTDVDFALARKIDEIR